MPLQRNDFGFTRRELKSLSNVGYCGKNTIYGIYEIINCHVK